MISKNQNRQWPSVRSAVERVFDALKQHYGIGKARYLGLHRNQAGSDGLQHQARRGRPRRDDGLHRINPSYARKTAENSQDFIKNGEINAYFSRVLPIRGHAYSKKVAFNHSAGVSVTRAKVSSCLFIQTICQIKSFKYILFLSFITESLIST